MKPNWLTAGAVLGLLGVAFGAFGAHALKSRVGADLLAVFETGVRYQMYHALALMVVGVVGWLRPGRWLSWAGGLMVSGVLVFSGSLYLMTLTGARWLGAVTPIGGVCLILGWAALVAHSMGTSQSDVN